MASVSYLDKPLTREAYAEYITNHSHSHQVNQRIAIDWFEKFLLGTYEKDMQTVLSDMINQKITESVRHNKNLFDLLQGFINYLSQNGQDPTTVRTNFNGVKKFLNWYGFEIFVETVRAKLIFPVKVKNERHALTIEEVRTLLNQASPKRRGWYLFLLATGMRLQETLKIRKRDLDFSHDRVMVVIPGQYTKAKKQRKTFLTKECYEYLKPQIDKLKDDEHIFTEHEDSLKAKHIEEDYFYRLRARVGLDEKYESSTRHKITIHIFRSWFITKCNRVDSDFGNALAGHDKYMKQYNRFTETELIDLFKKAEPELQIFDRKEDHEYVSRLENQIKEMQLALIKKGIVKDFKQ